MKRKNGKSDFQKNFLTKASIRAKQKKARELYAPESDNDMSQAPLAALCLGMEYIMQELKRRGMMIHDFDNKTKVVRQIQIIGGKVYFLAEEERRDEEGEAGSECQEV